MDGERTSYLLRLRVRFGQPAPIHPGHWYSEIAFVMDEQAYLYKVSRPRPDLTFQPSKFWRTKDWESSSTRPREGYIEDDVLFVGDFDEVNIHLFPRVHTVRVRSTDADASRLARLGLHCSSGMTAHVFLPRSRQTEVETFHPTVFKFDRHGFTRVRNGEYVSWRPQVAISSETFSMDQALEQWNINACYVEELDSVIRMLSSAHIYFDEQT